MKFRLILLSAWLLLACEKKTNENMDTSVPIKSSAFSYLALGDSYTIGESVSQNESFPFQLSALLNERKPNVVASPKVIARTGWTTSELQTAIPADQDLKPPYSIVTLLIGVNNQYRGQSSVDYRNEFKALLHVALGFAGGDKKKVFVVSIPDWGVTPFGKNSGRPQETIAKEIDLFNAINKEETLSLGISYTDITPGSRLAATDLSLIASDGLHPSGKMYRAWAEALLPKVEVVL